MKEFSGLAACAALAMLATASANAQITPTTLFSFAGTNGSAPNGSLVQGSDGNFYGTTAYGGEYPNNGPYEGYPGYGTVFRITPGGTFTSLCSFNGTNGGNPRCGLVEGPDGSFYGTTWYGGVSNVGTIFRVTTNGDLTSLVSFVGTNGAWPQSSLVWGNDGFLYGTTRVGGSGTHERYDVPGNGTVFKVSTNGALTTLFSFGLDTNGFEPFAPLVLGSDGLFYGTTLFSANLTEFHGTIFKIDGAGNLSTVAELDGPNRLGPYGGLIQGSDGGLYGLAYLPDSHETQLIRIATNGGVTTVSSDPSGLPLGVPSEAPDGNFYGTLSSGVCFQATQNGQLTYLASVTGTNGFGDGLSGTLMLGTDGSFYGTTASDGTPWYTGYGKVFRLVVPSAAAPLLRNLKLSSTNIQFSWGTLVGRSYQVQSSTDLTATNWGNVGTSFTATNRIASTCDSISGGPQRFYRVALLP